VSRPQNWHNVHSLSELSTGDHISHRGNGIRYVVIANYGDHVTAVRVADVTNPQEWQVLRMPPRRNDHRLPIPHAQQDGADDPS
jgi:hypothetical protein